MINMIKVITVVVISCSTTSATPVLVPHHLQPLHINANRARKVPMSPRSSCIHYPAAPHRMIGRGPQPNDDHYTTSGQGPDAQVASGNNTASAIHQGEREKEGNLWSRKERTGRTLPR